MIKLTGIVAIFAAVILFTMSAAGAQSIAPASPLNGIWVGEYTCAQGKTGLELSLVAVQSEYLSATFAFGPTPQAPGTPEGAFDMYGKRYSNGQFSLDPYKWRKQPPGYGMLRLEGILDGDRLIGSISFQGCTTFEVNRAPSGYKPRYAHLGSVALDEQKRIDGYGVELPTVALWGGRTLGAFGEANREFGDIVFSDSTVDVGLLQDEPACSLSAKFVVQMDVAPGQLLTAQAVSPIIRNVLAPMVQRKCPATENFRLEARFFDRSRAVTGIGEIVPAGSVSIPGESELLGALVRGKSVNNPETYSLFDAGRSTDHYPELASVEGLSTYRRQGSLRDPDMGYKTVISYINYSPPDVSAQMANVVEDDLLRAFATRDFPSFLEEDSLINTREMRQRGFIQAIIAYDDICGSTLSSQKVGYQEYFREITMVDVDVALGLITKFYEWKEGGYYYMEPEYLPLFEQLWYLERLEIVGAVFNALQTFGARETGGNQSLMESAMAPLLRGVKLRNDMKAYYSVAGCAASKTVIQNWFDYLINNPAVRPDDSYPTKKIEYRGLAKYYVAEVPSNRVPNIQFVGGQPMTVYIDRRSPNVGLSSYEIGGFHLGLLPNTGVPLLTIENSKLYDDMNNAHVRILSCRYTNGISKNYWLAGFPVPDADLQQRAGPSFIGVAAECPAM